MVAEHAHLAKAHQQVTWGMPVCTARLHISLEGMCQDFLSCKELS